MPREFIFKPQVNEVISLDPNEGSFSTPVMAADINYRFDKDDNTVRLDIRGMWMKEYDIEDLIAFLTAVKEAM